MTTKMMRDEILKAAREVGHPYPEADIDLIVRFWNIAMERAAQEMRPMLRSMVSRGEAADAIRSLKVEE